MELHDFLALIVSICSALISLTVGYFAFLQAPELEATIGQYLILFNTASTSASGEKVWGGVSFMVPVTFYNWSPRGGVIKEARLVIGQQSNNIQYFDMIWTSFMKLDREAQWEDEELARPIAISGRTSITKFVRFDWSPFAGEQGKFVVNSQQYDLRLFAWTEKAEKPAISYKCLFSIMQNCLLEYESDVAANRTKGIWIYLGTSRRPNNVITLEDVKRNYE